MIAAQRGARDVAKYNLESQVVRWV